MVEVEVYKQTGCHACETEIPKMKQEAKRLGIELKIVDVDRCPVDKKDTCNNIEWVPNLQYKGQEITIGQLAAIAKGEL